MTEQSGYYSKTNKNTTMKAWKQITHYAGFDWGAAFLASGLGRFRIPNDGRKLRQRFQLQPGDVLMNEGGDYNKFGRRAGLLHDLLTHGEPMFRDHSKGELDDALHFSPEINVVYQHIGETRVESFDDLNQKFLITFACRWWISCLPRNVGSTSSLFGRMRAKRYPQTKSVRCSRRWSEYQCRPVFPSPL